MSGAFLAQRGAGDHTFLLPSSAPGTDRSMRDDEPSRTASWIAMCRSWGEFLPAEARLADDPYAGLLGDARAARWLRRARQAPWLARALVRAVRPARAWIVYMQVRTRILDDVVRDFVA